MSECAGGGGICVSIEYVEGTVSPGALVCVILVVNEVLDFANMKLVTIPRNSIENFTIPVSSGEYRVIAFDLESNHLPNMPMSMVALSQDIMTVNSDGEGTCSVCYCCAIIIVIYRRHYQSTTKRGHQCNQFNKWRG